MVARGTYVPEEALKSRPYIMRIRTKQRLKSFKALVFTHKKVMQEYSQEYV